MIEYKGRRVGFHHMEFRQSGDLLLVDVHAEILVKIGFITFMDMRYEAKEVWQDGVLQKIETRTKVKDRFRRLMARHEGDGIYFKGTKFEGIKPLTSLPSSYWNPAILQQDELINTQHGKPFTIAPEYLGVSELDLPDGKTDVLGFSFNGKLEGNLFYTRTGEWVGAAFGKNRDAYYVLVNADEIPPRDEWRLAPDDLEETP